MSPDPPSAHRIRRTDGDDRAAGALRTPLPITEALRRVVLGFRLVSAGWLVVLVVVAVGVGPLSVAAVAGPVALALAWTAATVLVHRRGGLAHGGFVALDVGVAVALVLWHATVAVEDRSFLGGYPFSSVVLAAAMRGVVPGLSAAVVLSASAVGSAAAGLGSATTLASTVLLYLVGAATVAWGARVIRTHDERTRAIQAALADERAERVRSQERAETGAHLHDSVLQVLALIQRRADDPEQVTRLARAQERSLRAWLADDRRDTATSVGRRLGEVAAEIEGLLGVTVEVVTVGDAPVTDATDALVAASREAIMNAGRHSGAGTVSVFLHAGADEAVVYVRDRGSGFDPEAVPGDRRGVRDSIRGRLGRHGGNAALRTSPDRGTEWVLRAPVDDGA